MTIFVTMFDYVLYDYVWPYMTLYDYIWLYMNQYN